LEAAAEAASEEIALFEGKICRTTIPFEATTTDDDDGGTKSLTFGEVEDLEEERLCSEDGSSPPLQIGSRDDRPGRSFHRMVCAAFEVIRELVGGALEFAAQPVGKTSEDAEEIESRDREEAEEEEKRDEPSEAQAKEQSEEKAK
jgi:hypothetical protein